MTLCQLIYIPLLNLENEHVVEFCDREDWNRLSLKGLWHIGLVFVPYESLWFFLMI